MLKLIRQIRNPPYWLVIGTDNDVADSSRRKVNTLQAGAFRWRSRINSRDDHPPDTQTSGNGFVCRDDPYPRRWHASGSDQFRDDTVYDINGNSKPNADIGPRGRNDGSVYTDKTSSRVEERAA